MFFVPPVCTSFLIEQVLDANGYLRLVDFGSAKLLPVGCKASTLCGCALYLAPEVILSKGYNKSVGMLCFYIFFSIS